MKPQTDLETTVKEESRKLSAKEKIVDTFGTITYSLVAGAALDYAAGLNLKGILVSRGYGTIVNSLTGALYGKWRNLIFKATKTTEKSSKPRQFLTDLLAFNTFQVPLYSSILSVASYVSEGKIDFEKVKDGSIYLATISPLIGPTMGWYMDKFRKLVGVKSAPQQAQKNYSESK
jgi:hypothetical protein